MTYKVGETYLYNGWTHHIYRKVVVVVKVTDSIRQIRVSNGQGEYELRDVPHQTVEVKLPKGKQTYYIYDPERQLTPMPLSMFADVEQEGAE